jgi:hypothetical protein
MEPYRVKQLRQLLIISEVIRLQSSDGFIQFAKDQFTIEKTTDGEKS